MVNIELMFLSHLVSDRLGRKTVVFGLGFLVSMKILASSLEIRLDVRSSFKNDSSKHPGDETKASQLPHLSNFAVWTPFNERSR